MLRISCGHPNALVALYVTSTGKFHTELSNPLGEGRRVRSSADAEASLIIKWPGRGPWNRRTRRAKVGGGPSLLVLRPLSACKGQQFQLQSQAAPLQSQAPTGEPVSADFPAPRFRPL